MIEPPEIVDTRAETTAVIHLAVPRADIRTAVPAAIADLMAALTSQGRTPAGPLVMHHLGLSSDVFDVEVGFPVASPVAPHGRMRPGTLPASTVARTVYHGPYEGLFEAWRVFGERLDREGLLKSRGLSRGATLWERYLVGPESSPDAATWRTELNLPLQPAAA